MTNNFSIDNELLNLRDQMNANGVPFNGDFVMDGTIQRYCKDDSRERDEWYCGFMGDNYVRCVYGSWSSGHDDSYKYMSNNLTPEQVEAFKAEYNRILKQSYELRKQQQDEARTKAQQIISLCTKNIPHDYIKKKKIHSEYLVHNECVIVPFENIDGVIQSYERIFPDGSKRGQTGGKRKGNFFRIGDLKDAENIYICEGYATADSVHAATKQPTVATGGLNNIVGVSAMFKVQYPNAKLFFCRDVGKAADGVATTFKEKFGEVVETGSNKDGYDFNDLYIDKDIKELEKILIKKKYPIINMIELLSNNYPEPEWIIKNLVVENSTTMIHADGGVGKSMIALEMALAIAEGTTFICWKTLKQQKVLFIDSELNVNTISSRLKKTVLRRKCEFDPQNFNLICCADLIGEDYEPINLYSQSCRDILDRNVEQADVIFLDNLQNMTYDEGDGSENKNEFWQRIGTWMKKWKAQGKSFVIVHHEGKNGTPRGSSRQIGDCDQLIRLTPPPKIGKGHEGFHATMHPYKIRNADQRYTRPVKIEMHPKFTSKEFDSEELFSRFRGWKISEPE